MDVRKNEEMKRPRLPEPVRLNFFKKKYDVMEEEAKDHKESDEERYIMNEIRQMVNPSPCKSLCIKCNQGRCNMPKEHTSGHYCPMCKNYWTEIECCDKYCCNVVRGDPYLSGLLMCGGVCIAGLITCDVIAKLKQP